MRTTLAATCLAMLMAGAPLLAQDSAEEPRPEPKHSFRVLQHPYDIASFYRSQQGGPSYFGYSPETFDYSSRYPIAGYYRQRQAMSRYGYAPFWNGGYSSRNRAGIVIGYRRSIGENGDLFLFAPTFLAPVGPLSGIFFDPR